MTVSDTGQADASTSGAARILVVDDHADVRLLLQRVLTASGYEVRCANDGNEALQLLELEGVDLVITDLAMPKADGMTVLRRIREHDHELPVLLITGQPTTESAIRAVRYGATEYLTKPFSPETLMDSVRRALQMNRLAELRRAARLLGGASSQPGPRPIMRSLDERFGRALDALYMVYQPIVSWSGKKAFGYEALVRSSEPTLPNPSAIIEAAETLQRTEVLGRHIRAKAGEPFERAGTGATLFVNLHSRDLLDETLYDSSAPLAAWAPRTVLELTERAAIDDIDDISGRIARLRRLGYRIAVDDIGAGYSGLSSFAMVQPDFVKLDITLVRGIDVDPVRTRLVQLLTELCSDLGIFVVAEGVETVDERDALLRLGIDLLQGFLFARPSKPFPESSF